MPHGEIMRQIGQLFLLRMNINLVGNVLDSPVSSGPQLHALDGSTDEPASIDVSTLVLWCSTFLPVNWLYPS
jgi:uncharacterized Rmd1/YagE family protein